MDLTNMTDDELVAANQELGRQADAIRAQRIEINAELRGRASQAEIDALQARIDEIRAGGTPAVAPGAVVDVTTEAS